MTWAQEGFAHLFFVVCVCLLVHVESLNDMDKAALEGRVKYHIDSKAQETFCLLDSDHDGILTVEEAVKDIARRIGADPEEFHMFMDEKYGSWDSCWEGNYRQPGFFQIWGSGFFLPAGRIDWTPCFVSLWTGNIVKTSMGDYDEEWFFLESVDSENKLKAGMLKMAEGLPHFELYKFRNRLDKDRDGCLSKAEYDQYWTDYSLNAMSSPYINFTTVPEFSAIEEYNQLPRNTSMNNSSCVDEIAWQMWSLERIIDFFGNDSHANKSCKTQTPIQAEMDQSSTNLILAIVLGCCGLVAILAVSCVALHIYRNRQYRAKLDQANQVQKLLKAKIDAWSIFDVSLCTKACDLESAFRHSLGLERFDPEMFDLTNIAHPEDARVLQDMLAQLERDLDSGSLPQTTKVRFAYGETGENCRKSYTYTYVPVELLMAWGSETRSTVLVGITMLGEAPSTYGVHEVDNERPGIGTDDAPDVEALYRTRYASLSETAGSVRSQGEFILNGSDVMSCGESRAGTFRSMTANGHQGGQITKLVSDMKTSQIEYAFGLASDAVSEHKAAEQTPSPTTSTTEDQSRSFTSSPSHGTTSL